MNMFMFRPRLRLPVPLRRWMSSAPHIIEENDIVLLRPVLDPTRSILSYPLAPERSLETHRGQIFHKDIIGKSPRDIVETRKNVKFRITLPTLEEYIVNVRRMVTPVYPVDAATIVSLLDIHATDEAPVEIFEAGTGHGSLSMYLSRAIAASGTSVLHTLDSCAAHSTHAKKVITEFRRGIYLKNISFNVGDPGIWCKHQLAERDGVPFITHAILDLPAPERYLENMKAVVKTDGVLGVWCPSISQIMVLVGKVRADVSGFFCERVLEFPGGTGMGAGLRAWDVRPAVIRSKVRKTEEEVGRITVGEDLVPAAEAGEVSSQETPSESRWPEPVMEAFVCRPTVGERLVGGGFFALFRRKAHA